MPTQNDDVEERQSTMSIIDKIITNNENSTLESTSNQSPSINVRNEMNKKTTSVCFAVTNARSVAPKMDSVIETFNKLELAFMAITETWLVNGPS